jgi:predicted Zn-dependent protease
MSGFFYDMGKKVAPHLLKAKWVLNSIAGTEGGRQQSEREMGALLAARYRQHLVRDDDHALRKSLTRVVTRLTSRLRNSTRKFSVWVYTSPDLNAFALPGGYVFISRSLVDYCLADRREVTFALAHEIGHVVLGHAARRFLTESVVKLLSAAARGGTALSQATRSTLTRLLQTAYTQQQESEADRFAVHLLHSARIDPSVGLSFFSRLADASDRPTIMDAYLSSHPDFERRSQCIREEIGRLKTPARPAVVKRNTS